MIERKYFMFARIKFSARRALLGEELTVMPETLLMLILFLFFSLCNAVIYLFIPDLPETAKAVIAFASMPLALFTIAPFRHKMRIRYIRLYTGDRERARLRFEDGVSACVLEAMLFFVKIFYFAAYEVLPAAASAVLIYKLKTSEMSVNAVTVIACGIAAAFIIGAVTAFVAVQKYSRAGFYLAAYDGISPAEAIRLSTKHTEGKLLSTAVFKAGFLPWLLLCLLGVPSLFVMPYYRQSLTGFFISC